jgi:hypothetical protein
VSDDSDDLDPARPTAFNSADPPRNFTLSVNDRVRALTIGAPAYATRKKRIEDLEVTHVRALLALHDQLAAKGRSAAEIEQALHDKAHGIDLTKMNALIENHNRYYPIEANLPIDYRTGEYTVYGQRWLPEEPWTATRLLARAHAVLAARAER